MSNIIIIRGAICAGKTTTSTLLRDNLADYALIEPDIIKQMVDRTRSSTWRRQITDKTMIFMFNELVKRKRNVIVALHGHDMMQYRKIRRIGIDHGAKIYSFLLTAPLDVCMARNERRGAPGMCYKIPKSKILDFIKKTKIIKGEPIFNTETQTALMIVKAIIRKTRE